MAINRFPALNAVLLALSIAASGADARDIILVDPPRSPPPPFEGFGRMDAHKSGVEMATKTANFIWEQYLGYRADQRVKEQRDVILQQFADGNSVVVFYVRREQLSVGKNGETVTRQAEPEFAGAGVSYPHIRDRFVVEHSEGPGLWNQHTLATSSASASDSFFIAVTKGENGDLVVGHQYEYGNLYQAAKGRERFEEVERSLHLDFPVLDDGLISSLQAQLQEKMRLEQLRELEAKMTAAREARDQAAREEARNARERARQQDERHQHISDSWGPSGVPVERAHQAPRTEIPHEFPPSAPRTDSPPRTENPGSREHSQPQGGPVTIHGPT